MPTLEQIKDKMKKLQEQADKLIAKRAQSVLTDIRKLMEEHGLTTADIEPNSAEKKNRVRPAGSKSTAPTRKVPSTTAVNGARPAKYRHAKTGATWTGHGRAPAWIADAKDRSTFLIDGTDAGSGSKLKTAVKKAAVVGVAGAHKGQPKGPQTALYRDPKTGATWSGRGPAPAWLSRAKDRSKFLIAGVGGVANSSAASKPKAVAKKPATKTAVAKKATTAKKAAANATVSAKVAATKSATARKVVANGATPALKKAAKRAPTRKSVVAKKVVTKPGVAAAPEAAPAQATV